MSKFNTFLVAIGMVFLAFSAKAQLSFTFVPSDIAPNIGDTITVDAVVENFTNIASYQYSIDWNENHLTYLGVSNFNLTGLSAGNFGTTQIGNGILTTSWSDPFAGVQSLVDGTVLFSLEFEVITNGGVDTDINFASSPLGFEVIADNGSGLEEITSSVVFTGTTLEVNGGAGTGTGNIPCTFSGFGLTVSSDSAATGDPVCLDVAACNFTDLLGMSYTMQFDPTVLQFDEVTNLNLEDLEAGSFGTNNAGNGLITVAWFDADGGGVTVADETIIYSICFTAIGAGGEMDSVLINDALAPIDVTDLASNGSNIGLESIDGEVTITGSSGSAVTLIASQDQGVLGDTVSIDISVRNFDSITTFQSSMLWDPAIIDFFDVQSSGALPNDPVFNTSSALTDAGKLTFNWDDAAAQGVNLADDEIIFTIRYIITGNITDVSAVDFTDDPTPIEVTQVINGSIEEVPLAKIPGLVEVIGQGLLTLTIGEVTGMTGDTVCVPITVENFNEVVSMEYDVIWNSAELSYVNVQDFNLSGLGNGNFNGTNAGELKLSWFEPLLDPQTLVDGDTVYSMCFEILALSGTTPEITFDQTGTIEITDGVDPITNNLVDGGVVVNNMSSPMFVSDTTITNVLCFGDATGEIDIEVGLAVGTVSYTWSDAGGTTTQDISGLEAGNYTVTITDDNTTLIETYTITEPTAALAQTTSQENVSCNGEDDGEATVSPTGGTAPYTYAWDGGTNPTTATISDLTPGTYNVTVTDDNDCTVTASVTITEPLALAQTTSQENVSCNGEDDGEATVSPSGGTSPYTYAWDGGTNPTTATISDLAPGTYNVTVTDDNDCTVTASVTITEPLALAQTTSQENVSCNGEDDGEATISPSGGTSPYTYAWDGGTNPTTATISDLAPGTYNVTVTDDNDCTVTASVTITEPLALAQTTSQENVSCNDEDDGEATVSPTGGTSPYTYAWDGGTNPTTATISDLAPGTYNVTVTDDNDCTVTASVMITEPSALSVSMSAQDATSNGGSDGEATATPSGGTAPYDYDWMPGGGNTATIINLTAQTYTVTVTDDNGCTIVDDVIVGEPGAISASINGTNVSCNGEDDGEATAVPAGGVGPYDYDWSPNVGSTATVTDLEPGDYDVTITDDNGSTATATVTITEPTVLTVSVVDDNVSCNGEDDGTATATPSGGTGPYDYLWDDNAGSTTAMISDLEPGTYTVTITDDNGCTVEESTGVSEPAVLSVSGNVTNESALGANDGAITVTPNGGTSGFVYDWSPGGETTPTISGLAPGDYTVTITDGNDCTAEETFTVNEFDAPEITVVSVDHVDCNGGNTGAIDISVSGGLAPYDYDWGGGVTTQDRSNLTAGNYTVTVTDDNGTTAVETVTVNEASAIVIIVDGQINLDCNGDSNGSINISVSGGTGAYTYNWGAGGTNEDPTNLSAGTYTPTITDANNCTQVGTPVTITEPASINITVVSSTNVTCNGDSNGSIDITVTGGTTPYTYSWGAGGTNQDPTNLPAGNYTPTITDSNGCTQIGPMITISEPNALAVSSSSTSVSCNGENDGTISVNVSGGVGPYNYNWTSGLPDQPNHVGLSAGTYSVTITDVLGCSTVEGPIPVTQPTPLTVSNTVTNASAANNDGAIDITVLGGSPGYTYDWNNGETTEDLSNLPSGCYAVTIEDTNGCTLVDSIKVGGIIVVTDVTTDVSCAGSCDGAIDISVTGGIAPYTYNWAGLDVVPGAEDQDGLCAGNYAVTVSDSNGSLTSGTFTVGTPTALTLSNFNIQDETGNGCNGSINITVTGGTLPYTYQWSNGADNEDPVDLCKGDYNVTIVDANGCILISPTFQVMAPPLAVAMSNITMADCNGDATGEVCFSVLGGCGPYTVTVNGETQISVTGDDICFNGLAAGTYMIIIEDSGPQPNLEFPFTIIEPDAIVIDELIFNNTDPTGTNCNGSIDISVTGGTAPYSYQWSNGEISEDIVGLCESPPSYSVTVTDANDCIQILSGLEVELGLNIQVVSAEDVSCFDDCDGSIDIEVFGGIAPYEYIWGPTGQTTQDVNGLCADTYLVTVTDDAGTTATTTVTIDQPASALTVEEDVVVRPTNDNANGSIALNISGGWGSETVSWTGPNGYTGAGQAIGGLIEGFYTATITDANGCVEIITVDLVAYRLILEFEMGQPSCNGEDNGTIDLFVSEGSGDYTISWDNGQGGASIFELTAGEYTVTVVDNIIPGLSVEQTVTLGQPDALEVAINITNATGPADGVLEAVPTGGTAPYNYLWNTENADATPIVTRVPAGTYGLIVTDDNGCEEIISPIEVEIMGECLEARKVISPNNDGKNDELIISCVEGLNSNLKIFNRWGQLVYEADNYDNTWMGTEQDGSTLLPESGYFWVLEYQEAGQTIQLKGAFTLLRDQN